MKKYEFRPWGRYITLSEGKDYKVKEITVLPGQQISLQYHDHRKEYWTVVEGNGYVRINEKIELTTPGSNFVIDIKDIHRLSAEESGITIIEVQRGEECSEEDIVRLEDDYSRV